MRKDSVILFYPRPNPYAEALLPLNLMALARMLDPQLYKTQIINATAEEDSVEKILDQAKKGNLLCIGVTAMTGYQILDALRLTERVKEHFPHIPIVWGGYHPTLLPLETIKNPTVDIIVAGQGEITFSELIARLSNDLPLDDVPGLVYKTEEGRVKVNPDRPFENLDTFPCLPWHLVSPSYVQDLVRWGRIIDYYTSQGCPFPCGFCAEPMFCKRRWTGLNAKRVVAEIKMLKSKYDLDAIIIRDSNFFVNKERVRGICEGLIQNRLQIKLVGVNARVDTLLSYEDGLWEMLYSAGFRELLIGAESGSQAALDLINKGIKIEDTLRFLEKATQYGLQTSVSLMFGLPGINHRKDFESTLNFVDKFLGKSSFGISECFIFHYIPYPGSALYELAQQHGFTPPLSLKGWSRMDLLYPSAPWIDRKCSRQANYLSLYILRRLFRSHPIGYRLVELVLRTFVDPIFRWRWRHRYFGFFVERYGLDSLYRLAALKTRFWKLIHYLKPARRA